jgi:hypothetical protein
MYKTVAPQFEALRKKVKELSGRDFLAICGDIFRSADFMSNKDGVANRSNHKTGRAFDYNQDSLHLIIEKDPLGSKMYFRTYINCEKQDGSQGQKRIVKDYRGHVYKGYCIDFTELASQFGFTRIPAWNGWQSSYNRREFWHYEDMIEDGRKLTWDEAMLALKDKTREYDERVYGLNDRGKEVLKIQGRLSELGILPMVEIDGVFGPRTFAAVKQFQKERGFTPKNIDGLVGPMTMKELFKE